MGGNILPLLLPWFVTPDTTCNVINHIYCTDVIYSYFTHPFVNKEKQYRYKTSYTQVNTPVPHLNDTFRLIFRRVIIKCITRRHNNPRILKSLPLKNPLTLKLDGQRKVKNFTSMIFYILTCSPSPIQR